MADENKPEATQRVRFNHAVMVDGVTHPAKTYEVDVPQSAVQSLVAAGRVSVVQQEATQAAATAVPQPVLTPEQVAAVTAALTTPVAPAGPATPAVPAAHPKP